MRGDREVTGQEMEMAETETAIKHKWFIWQNFPGLHPRSSVRYMHGTVMSKGFSVVAVGITLHGKTITLPLWL